MKSHRKYDYSRIWDLWQAGKTYRRIAQEMEMSCGNVFYAVSSERHRRGLEPQTQPNCEELLRETLSVESAAEYFSMSRTQMYRLMRLNLIKSIHVGRQRRIYRSTLDAFLEEQSVVAAVAPAQTGGV